jgi:uncharacterized alpha-E superfamily protein
MSRYLERADNVARFIDVNAHLILDMGVKASAAQWQPLVITSGDEEDFAKRYKDASEKNALRFLTFDENNPNSIYSCICSARENARTVREVIPSDMWEEINDLYHLVQRHSRKKSITDLEKFYNHIRTANYLFTGLMDNVMSHGEAWHFARMGRMLERADKTARILDVKYFLLLPNPEDVDSPTDTIQWGAVLKSANAFEMYRKQFHRINYKNVAQFLVFDPVFPRSMTHCVNTVEKSLNTIIFPDAMNSPAKLETTKLRAMLSASSIENVLKNGLHEFIDIFQFNLNIVDGAIYNSFFAPQTA